MIHRPQTPDPSPYPSVDQLRRKAKALRRDYERGAPAAIARLRAFAPHRKGDLKHADFLHVIAREQNFQSWPKLKLADETIGLSRAQKQTRLRVALMQGQHWVTRYLLEAEPDLPEGDFGAQIALYDRAAVEAALAADPQNAVRPSGPRSPILHLAFSRHWQDAPERGDDVMAIAKMLVAHGADVSDAIPVSEGIERPLTVLYAALSHSRHMPLARWLLEQGADPNDGEVMYHATELGHHEGLEMLLAHGAVPKGTNALGRALDFDDPRMVEMILGADVGDDLAWILHHAAKRGSCAEVIALLLDAGADPFHVMDGATPYGMARVYGNTALSEAIEARGAAPELSRNETLLAAAAEGRDMPGQFVDVGTMPEPYRDIIREIIGKEGALAHIRRLVALGVEYDKPAALDVTPVQIAGWEGLTETMAFLLEQRPDLGHVNAHGGKLLGAIIHGAEHCPRRDVRDHIGCARMALEHGVALPQRDIETAGDEDMAAFLASWAEAHPGQVTEGGAG